MALSEIQGALARLFTDEAARAAFLEDPESAARALGLGGEDGATLARLAPHALRQFARSLQAKRALDARKMIPLTARALGAAFADHLSAAAASLAPGASRAAQARALAHRLDAHARVGAAQDWIGDLARYEAAFVEAAHSGFTLRLLLFRYPVAKIATALLGGAAIGGFAPRLTLGVWARPSGGRLFHSAWPLTPGERS
jgi:hypothetical protein